MSSTFKFSAPIGNSDERIASVESERQRLEREVIEAAKEWLTENELAVRLSQAIRALNKFESKHVGLEGIHG